MLQEFDVFDYEDESYQTSDLWKIYQTSYSIKVYGRREYIVPAYIKQYFLQTLEP